MEKRGDSREVATKLKICSWCIWATAVAAAMAAPSLPDLADRAALSTPRLLATTLDRWSPSENPAEVGSFAEKSLATVEPAVPTQRDLDRAKALDVVLAQGDSRLEPDLLADTIVELAWEYDLQTELLLAVIQTESSFRPKARSRAGAVGLMQVLPSTARPVAGELGIPWEGRETLHDPVANLRIGTHYLAHLRDLFDGDLDLAISAYNMGPGNVRKSLRRGRRPRSYRGRVESHRRSFESWSVEHPEPDLGRRVTLETPRAPAV